jgi:hypothetical protein
MLPLVTSLWNCSVKVRWGSSAKWAMTPEASSSLVSRCRSKAVASCMARLATTVIHEVLTWKSCRSSELIRVWSLRSWVVAWCMGILRKTPPYYVGSVRSCQCSPVWKFSSICNLACNSSRVGMTLSDWIYCTRGWNLIGSLLSTRWTKTPVVCAWPAVEVPSWSHRLW